MIPNTEAIAGAPNAYAPARASVSRRLLAELPPYRRQLLLVVALILLGVGAQAAGPWLVGVAIDRSIMRGDKAGLAQTMVLLLAAYGVMAFAMRGQMYQLSSISRRILTSLSTRLSAHYQRLPLGYFHRRPVGDLISRVVSDVETLNQFYSQNFLISLFGLAGTLAVMLMLNVRLALVSFAVIPLMFLTSYFVGARARRAFRKTRETTSRVSSGLHEGIVGVRETQAFNRAETNIARFRQHNAANRRANVGAAGIASTLAPAIDVLTTLGVALVIGYGSHLVFEGDLTVGTLAGFLLYVQQFFRPIQFIMQGYGQLQTSMAGGERIFSTLDEELESDGECGALKCDDAAGGIEFDRVSFSYEPGQPVLSDVSFHARPGETVALVGKTGAGKSTIANLILRFYDVSGGAVRIGGRDVREVTRRSLRERVGIVLQEPFLFNGTVADNIGYGRLGATREEIEAAARAVNAHQFIMELPQGYDTAISGEGRRLSQGQRQILSFARTLLADPQLLILDEATSNIDARTESHMQGALTALLAGRTSLVIAHRLSTIRSADQILVMDGGRVAERGTHEELLAKGGAYAELYASQFK